MFFNPNQWRKTIITNCFLYILLYLTGEVLTEAENFSFLYYNVTELDKIFKVYSLS
jgi:sugar (pentulose or hexulose) kinase